MKYRRGLKILLVLAICLTAGFSIIVYRAYRSSLPLLARSTKLMPFKLKSYSFSAWISDHEFLAMPRNPRKDRGFVRINTKNKKIIPMTDLDDQLIKSISSTSRWKSFLGLFGDEDIEIPAYSRLVSPDAKWLIVGNFFEGESGDIAFCPANNDPIRREVKIVSVEGNHPILTFTKDKIESGISWLADSKRWVEVNTAEIVIHSVEHPNTVIRLPLNEPKIRQLLSGHHLLPGSLVSTPDSHIIMNLENYIDGKVVLFDVDLKSNPDKIAYKSIKLTRPSHFGNRTVSPDGKWLAWINYVVYMHPTPWTSWIQRYFPFLKKDPSRPIREMWISRLDGSDSHIVGYMLIPKDSLPPSVLFWSQDSKELYFDDGQKSLWSTSAGN